MYHVRLFIVEKMGFGMAPRQCGIQKTCLSDWALYWPWALEFQHHWGMGP